LCDVVDGRDKTAEEETYRDAEDYHREAVLEVCGFGKIELLKRT
jgi:hypothetical protein